MSAKPYEVTVLGATGFTGRQAVRALLHRAAGRPLRWAVAGRNREKLAALVTQSVPAAAAQPGVVVADLSDLPSLQALAAQTDVLLNLAGPYALTGEAVVQACIAHGTHHLDLTGETFWGTTTTIISKRPNPFSNASSRLRHSRLGDSSPLISELIAKLRAV